MSQLFLSPHLDDAPLSCGGRIHQLTRAGGQVTVVTICAGDPPPGQLSDYALSLHARWGQAPEAARDAAAAMVETRRAEDRAALAVLGAEARHLEVPDVIYRRGQDGEWLVDSDAALFAGFRAADASLVERLAERILDLAHPLFDPRADDARLYVPLGIGDHADHHLVRRAAERAMAQAPALASRCRYYEDYPYAAEAGSIAAATDAEAPGAPWQVERLPLAEVDLAAQIASVACYRSQISSFWRDLDHMAEALRDFATSRGGVEGPAEMLWRKRSA